MLDSFDYPRNPFEYTGPEAGFGLIFLAIVAIGLFFDWIRNRRSAR